MKSGVRALNPVIGKNLCRTSVLLFTIENKKLDQKKDIKAKC